jgi:hypothetical protein
MPADVRRFVATDLRAHRSTAAVAPIDTNSTSVAVTAAAYWGSTSPHPAVVGAQVPSPVGAWMPFNVDTQITSAADRMRYGSASTAAGSSFADLLQR